MRGRLLGLLLVASSLLLVSCGFHLRGTAGIAERYQPMVVGQVVAGDGQEQMIRRALERAGVLPGGTQTATANRLDLVLSRQRDTRLNTRGNNTLLLIEQRASLTYSLVDADGAPIQPETAIKSSQTVELDSDNVLSHGEVLDKARKDQDSELLRALIGRLRN